MKFSRIFSAVAAGALALTCMTGSVYAAKSRVSVHDPSIIKDPSTGKYYVFGSHIEAAKTTDLQNWHSFANGYAVKNNVIFDDLSGNLAKAFAWSGENLEDCAGGFAVWAPDVFYNPDYINPDGTKGAYLMYFCTSSTYMRSVIAYAASRNIEGPYRFVDTLIYSGFTQNDSFAVSSTKNVNRKYTSTNIDELIAQNKVTFNPAWFSSSDYNNGAFPNAIDPTIYTTPDGKMYMCYGSWSGGLFTLEIDKSTGRCIHPASGKTADGRMIDSYFGTQISGGYRKSGEGPFIEYNPDTGYYYLWVTYGGLVSEGGYNMRVFRSRTPDGPFIDAAERPAVLGANTNLDSIGLKVMGNYKFSELKTAYMAGGHNSVLRDDNSDWYLFYHTRFDDGFEYHEVRVHSMYFNEDGWPVVAPHEYSGDKIAPGGYSTNDIAGNYEFINHGTDTSKTIHSYVNITLSADGKISGGASGTWTQNEDTAAADFVIGGQKYSGFFIAEKNESGKKVMTFTAVGKNNQTVWGTKTDEYFGSERPEGFLTDGYYTIKNLNSGKWVTVDNTNVLQHSTSEAWKFTRQPDGLYTIQNAGGLAMTVANSDGTNGNNVFLSELTQDISQKFRVRKNTDGTYAVLSACSDFYGGLDVFEISKEDGANICQWMYWSGDGQKFILNRTEAPVVTGDINADMSVTAADLRLLIEYLTAVTDTLPDRKNADIDNSGTVNILDLILLKNIFLES